MKDVKDIYGEVNRLIGDKNGHEVGRSMFIELLRQVLIPVAQSTEVWIARYQVIPNPAVLDYDDTFAYSIGDRVIVDDVVYECIAITTGNTPPNAAYWTVVNTANTYENYAVTIPYESNGVVHAPFKLLRVQRIWNDYHYETIENSIQTVAAGTSIEYPLRINKTRYTAANFATQFIRVDNGEQDGITLIFSVPFEVGERVVIDYIKNVEFNLTTIEDDNVTPSLFPEFLFDTLVYGVVAKVLEPRVLNQGYDPNNLERFQMKYERALKAAMVYARNYKDKNSTIVAKPNGNFLSKRGVANSYG
jgi:hypothetical protein